MKVSKEIKPIEYYLELNYPITIYRAEEGGYVAEIENLPGCITEGDTLEEVTQRIENARNAWIQAAYEDGIEIPPPRTDEEYSGKFMVRIPRSLHRRLAEQATREGVSLNQYVESILSAGASAQYVIERIIVGSDRIPQWVATWRTPLAYSPSAYWTLKCTREETEREASVRRFGEIEDREKAAI